MTEDLKHEGCRKELVSFKRPVGALRAENEQNIVHQLLLVLPRALVLERVPRIQNPAQITAVRVWHRGGCDRPGGTGGSYAEVLKRAEEERRQEEQLLRVTPSGLPARAASAPAHPKKVTSLGC